MESEEDVVVPVVGDVDNTPSAAASLGATPDDEMVVVVVAIVVETDDDLASELALTLSASELSENSC